MVQSHIVSQEIPKPSYDPEKPLDSAEERIVDIFIWLLTTGDARLDFHPADRTPETDH